jgi:pyruvate formate lyase activating enzyme
MKDGFNIKGFIPVTFVDWPGKVSAVVFLGGCGFRCPACHNHVLVTNPGSMQDYPLDAMLASLKSRRQWIDGVTVTGGEPTDRKNLPELLKRFKKLGLTIKLDTNGSRPKSLERLIKDGLVDAVSMDVKAPLTPSEYSLTAGVPVDVSVIQRSIDLLRSSGLDITFRTTIIPDLVEEPELAKIRRTIGRDAQYILQPFRNMSTLDPAFQTKEEFPLERFETMRLMFENTPETIDWPEQIRALAG